MGIGKSSRIDVTFDHANGFYYSGERVNGIISFHNTHKKLTLNNISIGFIGEFGYTALEAHEIRDGTGYVQTEDRVVDHRVPFISNRIPSVHSMSKENKIILPQGKHSWPFEFTLPESLPPSLGSLTDSHPHIKYYVYIVFGHPWYKSNEKHTYPLTIFPYMNIAHINRKDQLTLTSEKSRKHFELTANLHQKAVLPGQKISFGIDVKNPKQLNIKQMKAILIQYREVANFNHSEIIIQMDLPIQEYDNAKNVHKNFELLLPSHHLLPTHHSMSQYSTLIIAVNIRYELIIEATVDGLPDDIDLNIPVIIGTTSEPNELKLKEYNYTEPPMSYSSIMKEKDALPTYAAAVENLTFL